MVGVRFLLVLLVIFQLSQVEAQRRSKQATLSAPEYFREFQSRKDQGNLTRVVLKNGLTILVEEHPSSPLVAVTTYLRTAASLGPDLDGLVSQALAEVLSRENEVMNLSYDAGAVFGTKKGPGGVRFSSLSPADQLEEALTAHAALLNPVTPEKDNFGRAFGLVTERMSRAERHPFIYSKNRLSELLAPASAMKTDKAASSGRPVSPGWIIDNLDRLVALHRSAYHPRNLILGVSGAVAKETALELAIRHFGQLGKDAVPGESKGASTATVRIKEPGLKYLHRRGTISTPHIAMGYRVPGLEHEDHSTLLLLSYVLGQGESGLLGQRLIRTGIVFTAESMLEAASGSGIFWILMRPDPGKVDQAEVQALTQIQILGQQGISSWQLARAKALLAKDFYRRMEDLEQRSLLLVRTEAVSQFWERQPFLQQIQQIDRSQIQRVAKRYFHDSHLAIVEYFPKKAEERTFTLDSFREMLQLLVPASIQRQITETEVALGSSQKQDFVPLKFRPVFGRGDLRATSILRGPTVHFREDRSVPLVHIGLFFPGGRSTESTEHSGATELIVRTSFRSMLKAKGELSWNDLEMMGAEIGFVNEPDFFGLQATVLSRHTPDLFGLLIDWFRSPTLDPEVFEAEWQRVQAELEWQEDEWFHQAMRRTRQLLFGNHSYALNRLGTKESLAKITLEEVQSRMDSQMTGIHPWIFLRGDVQGTSFLGDFVSQLSDSRFARRDPLKRNRRGQPAPPQPERSGEYAQYERNGTVVLGLNGPAQGTRDWLIWEVWQTLLFSPELSKILTSELQTPVLDFQLFREAGLSRGGIFAFALSPQGSEKATGKELLRRLSGLEQAPFTRDDLLNAVVGAITRFHLERQSGSDDLLLLAKQVLGGHGVEFQREYISGIKLVTPSQIRTFARRYFPGNAPKNQEATQRP